MRARIVIPTAAGELVSYDIACHSARGASHDLRIVFSTSEEPFERWLFYLLRELGGHVVTDDPISFRDALGLNHSESGVVDEHDVIELLWNRNAATV